MNDTKRPVIYVVVGKTGEYSDRMEWSVAAYRDEALAQEHVRLADAWARQFHLFTEESNEWRGDLVRRLRPLNPYDPNFEMDYTGTTYYYDAVPTRNTLPGPVELAEFLS